MTVELPFTLTMDGLSVLVPATAGAALFTKVTVADFYVVKNWLEFDGGVDVLSGAGSFCFLQLLKRTVIKIPVNKTVQIEYFFFMRRRFR
jgi:hypothetical protein